MPSMRLLIATPLYPPEPGGPATYAKLLEAELPKRGTEVAVLAFRSVRAYPKLVRHIAYFVLTLRALRDADAVLALDPVSVGLPAMLAAKLLRKPFFVKVVGDYAWEQGSQRFGVRVPLDEFVRTKHVPVQVAFLRAVESMVANAARAVIVPSEYLKGIVSTWGIDPSRIAVVYNAMKAEATGTLPSEVASAHRPRVVSAGRLVPWKGFPGLVAAMVSVRTQHPEAFLAIAGDGPDRDALEAYAHARLGASSRLLGALSHADTLALIEDADVFVLNSTYEGLSHLLIEALALGKPIVATAVGGNPELIEDGKNGLLVPVNDPEALSAAISHLLSTPAHREVLGRNAKESASRFTVSRMADATLATLSERL